MKKIFTLLKTIYYYLESSYKIWKVRRLQKDDLIYTTKKKCPNWSLSW